MESGKKSHVWIWASVAAATTGIVAMAAIARYRAKTQSNALVNEHLRGVQDVLTDCYRKIHEIEANLPAVLSERLTPRGNRPSRPVSNGKPVLDS